jgi:ubiquinone/menaquinone biosynthesis C-methylase UbiE
MATRVLSAEGAFDRAAQSYDEEFESLPATRRLRRAVWEIFHRYFHPGDTLLELNCGTGTDAIELASKGMRIIATDASAEMVNITRRKIERTGLHSLITPMQLPFQRLRSLSDQHFDGAYSNFGGLNCAPRLEMVATDLAALVKRGKYVVLCLLSDFSFWETASFLVRGKWKKAFRRRQPLGVLADVKGEKVWVHYYSPEQVKKLFSPFFVLVEMKGLNIFSPPPSSLGAHRILGRGVRLLEALDNSIPKNARIQSWGDHVVYVFRRTGG